MDVPKPGEFIVSPKSLLWRPDTQSLPDGGYRSIGFYQETQTLWTRLWVNWHWLQPYTSTANPATDTTPYTAAPSWYSYFTGTPADYVAGIDQQIALARSYGLNVVLTLAGFPRWSNGTANVPSSWDPYGQYDSGGNPLNRLTANGSIKALEYKPPTDLSVGGPYGAILSWLIARYASQVYFLEIMNEPNLQWWPQKRSDGVTNGFVASATAQMMETAYTLCTQAGSLPRLMAPAPADTYADSLATTGLQQFVGDVNTGGTLLHRLAASTVIQDNKLFAWSHHNYADVKLDLGDQSKNPFLTSGPGDTRVHWVRQKLVNAWAGWPYADSANPYVMITEGGAQVQGPNQIQDYYGLSYADALTKHANLLTRNWKRMKGDVDPLYSSADSPGIGMIAQYLWYTQPSYDSGLLEVGPNGAKRPAYTAWANENPAH